jgi:hypothetical protein
MSRGDPCQTYCCLGGRRSATRSPYLLLRASSRQAMTGCHSRTKGATKCDPLLSWDLQWKCSGSHAFHFQTQPKIHHSCGLRESLAASPLQIRSEVSRGTGYQSAPESSEEKPEYQASGAFQLPSTAAGHPLCRPRACQEVPSLRLSLLGGKNQKIRG